MKNALFAQDKIKISKAFGNFCLALIFGAFLFPQNTLAVSGINKQLSYYGVLKNSSGVAVPDGNNDVVFKIYDLASGGSALWTGNYTAANSNPVQVKDGNFMVMLGSGNGNDLNLDFSQDTYYVGLTVAADAEMSPRQKLGAAAYAFNSDMVDGTNILKVTTTPEGSQNGSVGDIALDTNNKKLYIKILGTNTNTGWSEVVGSGGPTTFSGLTDTNVSSPSAGNILVLNGSSKWANVAMSGDVTLDSMGAVTIAPNAVTNSKIADSTISFSKLASNSCSSGQIPKFDGTAWTCGDDSTGSMSNNSILSYGAKCDGMTITDISTSAGSSNISSANYSWPASRVGELITIAGAGAASSVLNTTIVSVNGKNATLASSAGTAIVGTGISSFGANDVAGFQAAVNAANANTNGGNIEIPNAMCIVSGTINWLNNVGMHGFGWNKSIIKQISTTDMTQPIISSPADASGSNMLKGLIFRDFEIDAEAATLASYVVTAKGMSIPFSDSPIIQGLYVHGSPATCVAPDTSKNAYVVDNRFENCGRMNNNINAGGAGLGIGVGGLGSSQGERYYVSGNTFVLNHGTYGVFFETEIPNSTQVPPSVIVTGNHCEMGGYNSRSCIADSGVNGAIISNNRIVGNSSSLLTGSQADGIRVDPGTLSNSTSGVQTKIIGNYIKWVQTGIHVDYANLPPSVTPALLDIESNTIYNTLNSGLWVKTNATYVVDRLFIKNNIISESKGTGMLFQGAGGFKNLVLQGNDVFNASFSQAGMTNSLLISSPVNNLWVENNRFIDTQASHTQHYAMDLDTYNFTNVYITGNDLRGSTGASNFILTNSATVTGIIKDNVGYNAGGPAVVVPSASPWTYTSGTSPETLYLYGGTVSDVSIGGVTIANGSPAQIKLPPNTSAVVTYTAVPSATKYAE